jgi:hypothetical protein
VEGVGTARFEGREVEAMSEHWRNVWRMTGRFFLSLFALCVVVALMQAWNGKKPCHIEHPSGAPLRLC